MAYFKGYGWLLTGLMAMGTTACFDTEKDEDEDEEESSSTSGLSSTSSSSSDGTDGSDGSDGADGGGGGSVSGTMTWSFSDGSSLICEETLSMTGSEDDWCGICEYSFELDYTGDGGCEGIMLSAPASGYIYMGTLFEYGDYPPLMLSMGNPYYLAGYVTSYGGGSVDFYVDPFYVESLYAYYGNTGTINY